MNRSSKPRAARHATFVVERAFEAAPSRVFAAFSRPAVKAKWFAYHDGWRVLESELHFHVGGNETYRLGARGGLIHAFDGRFFDIVPDTRIVYAYDMYVGDEKTSVSLATLTFEPLEGEERTRVRLTEQITCLDGYEDLRGREEGTRLAFDSLGRFLAAER
jgi:uncharacterized protein YndB with AHSA1/START domain